MGGSSVHRNDQADLARALDLPEWNAAASDLLGRDPVAQTVRAASNAWAASGRKAAVDIYLQTAANDSDPRVRYWALNFASERRTSGPARDTEDARQLEAFCATTLDNGRQLARSRKRKVAAANKLERAVAASVRSKRVPLDVARLESIYFNFLLYSNRYDEAEALARRMAPTALDEVPIDINPYLRETAPMRACFNYLVLQSRYVQAAKLVAAFKRFYPGSFRNRLYTELAQKLAKDSAYGVKGTYPDGDFHHRVHSTPQQREMHDTR